MFMGQFWGPNSKTVGARRLKFIAKINLVGFYRPVKFQGSIDKSGAELPDKVVIPKYRVRFDHIGLSSRPSLAANRVTRKRIKLLYLGNGKS